MPISRSYSIKLIDILIPMLIITFDYKKMYLYIRNNKILIYVLLLTSLIFISYSWSFYNDTSPNIHKRYSDIGWYFKYYFKYFLFFLFLLISKVDKQDLSLLLNIFLLSMFINELISYGIVFELWETEKGNISNPIPFHKNHITYSTFIGFTILLSIYKIQYIKNNYQKLFYLIFLITMSINLFMSAGRTGQLSLLITLIVLIFIHFRKDIKKILLSISTIVIVLLISYNTINTFNNRINQAVTDINNLLFIKKVDSSFGTRILAIDTIPYLINKNNILLGVGMGNKPTYISDTIKETYPHRLINFDNNGMLHNSHVEILISNGVVGLFLYLSIFYFLFTIKLKDKFIKYIAQSFSIYLFCFGMSADIFYYKQIMMFMAFFISIIIIQYEYERNEIKSIN